MTIFHNNSNCFFVDLNELQQQFSNLSQNKLIIEELLTVNCDIKNNNLQLIISNNINLNKPIYLINKKNNNFNLNINIGNNSKLTIIEHKNNQNNTTYLNCHQEAELDYYLIQEEDSSTIKIQQHANTKLIIKLLSNKIKNNSLKLEANFTSSNATLDLNVLQYIKQHASNKIDILINHLTTNNYSSTTIRAIADDYSCANLTGKIIVNKGAQKTFADLQSKSLILNKHASVISCPELDIYNNDVMCTHGSSIGHLDLNALFYMQSRGICLTEAKQLLTTAFIAPIIKKINYSEIIDYLNY